MSYIKNFETERVGNAIVINGNSRKIVEKVDQQAAYLHDRDLNRVTEINQFSVNKMGNNGRWTEKEHLIFLAGVIEFGRDWKKIEFYVQTRSSSQARSHAQKVLKKMDRNAIFKEINLLKSKLNFKAKDHGGEGLTFLSDNQADINRLMESKRNTKRQKLQENDEFEVSSNKTIHLSEMQAKTPDNTSQKLVKFGNTVEKCQKSNSATPITCAGTPSTPNSQDFILNREVIQEHLKSESNSHLNNSGIQKSGFRNLKENMIESVKINQQNVVKKAENVCLNKEASNISENISSDDIEDGMDLFDFDLYSIFKGNSSSSIEDFKPLNSLVNVSSKDVNGSDAFKDFSFMGDTQFPLWMQY